MLKLVAMDFADSADQPSDRKQATAVYPLQYPFQIVFISVVILGLSEIGRACRSNYLTPR